jgi:hypothetical protein
VCQSKIYKYFFYSFLLNNINTQIDKLLDYKINQKCYLHSKVTWFTESGNSLDISHFAVFLIDFGTKVSMVKSYIIIYSGGGVKVILNNLTSLHS